MYIYILHIHIYIYMVVSNLFSNKKNSKDRQHKNLENTCTDASERSEPGEAQRALLDCNAHNACSSLYIYIYI